MSRSTRKTPVAGINGVSSDKPFKKIEHRRARRAIRVLDLTVDEPTPEKAFGNPWYSEKDSKLRFDPDDHPKGIRK